MFETKLQAVAGVIQPLGVAQLHPRTRRALPADAPPTSRPPLAVREDGGVVWSSDGAPFAHPVSCLL